MMEDTGKSVQFSEQPEVVMVEERISINRSSSGVSDKRAAPLRAESAPLLEHAEEIMKEHRHEDDVRELDTYLNDLDHAADASLEKERYFDVTWWRLTFNKAWKSKIGSKGLNDPKSLTPPNLRTMKEEYIETGRRLSCRDIHKLERETMKFSCFSCICFPKYHLKQIRCCRKRRQKKKKQRTSVGCSDTDFSSDDEVLIHLSF